MKFLDIPAGLWYNGSMKTKEQKQQLLREALHLQAMEDNPLSADQIAVFEMFEREGWTPAKRLAHLKKRARKGDVVPAAE